jgi:hypothetical protein
VQVGEFVIGEILQLAHGRRPLVVARITPGFLDMLLIAPTDRGFTPKVFAKNFIVDRGCFGIRACNCFTGNLLRSDPI